MNTLHRKPLPGTKLDYFDTRAAVDAIQPGAYDKLKQLRIKSPKTLPAVINKHLSQEVQLTLI